MNYHYETVKTHYFDSFCFLTYIDLRKKHCNFNFNKKFD